MQAEPASRVDLSRNQALLLMACMNCGHDRVEAYCARCGQRVHRSPFGVRSLARQAADDLFNLDQGLLHTAVGLIRRPGWMIGEYLRGRTRPVTNPAKYLLVCVALAVFAFHYSGLLAAQLEWMGADAAAVPDGPAADAIEILTRYFNIILVLAVPFFAAFSRMFFSRAGYNFAEHVIFNVFVFAQQNLLFALTIPVYILLPDVGTYLAFWTLVIVVYYVWACGQLFRVSWFSAMVRAVLVNVCGYLTFWVLIGFAIRSWVLVIHA